MDLYSTFTFKYKVTLQYKIICLFTTVMLPCLAQAAINNNVENEIQDLDSIKNAATEYAHSLISNVTDNKVEVEVAPIDPRLRLTKCDVPLETFNLDSSRTNGAITIGVKCTSPKPWKVYLPTRSKVMQPVVVINKPLAKGDIIDYDHITVLEKDVNSLPNGYFSSPEAAVGKLAKYNFEIGRVLTPNAITPPKIILRGEEIMLQANSNNINVKISGIALTDGRKGDKIQVRNKDSKRIVEGIVVAPGKVEVRS